MENEVKESTPKSNYVSAEEYFEIDMASDKRLEYYDGKVTGISACNLIHSQIQTNVLQLLGSLLKDKNCGVFPHTMRIGIPLHNTYLYPDASVVCGYPELMGHVFDTILNPSVVIEILSPAPLGDTKFHKFWHYQHISPFKELILIESRKRQVHIIRKLPNGTFCFEESDKTGTEFTIQALNITVSLSEIYQDTSLYEDDILTNVVREPVPKYNYISPDEYLAIERASEEKHEYYNGFIIEMGGTGIRHSQVAVNLYSAIGNHLKGKQCQMLPSKMRVAAPDRNAYMYPDASIVCSEPQLEDEQFDTLLNPSAVIEIWSPSTQKKDAGYKFQYYQNIPSLKEYIMIDPDKQFVQVIRKQPDGKWYLESFFETDGGVNIKTINLNISFADIYRNTGIGWSTAETEVKPRVPKYTHVSPEQYLEMERASIERHEYYRGDVFTMLGASKRHAVIVKNVNTIVLPFLKGKPCDMYGNDLRLHIPENSLYTYPDFSIICGKPETTDNEEDTIIQPATLIEVLSKSSKDYDRGTKFRLYREIKTLQEYILIDSTGIGVEVYKRHSGNNWLFTEFKSIGDQFPISVIGLTISLNDIYEGIKFTD